MRLYITVAIIFNSFCLYAQTLTFEDQDFLDALLAEGIDSNNDSLIQVSEAESVYDLEIIGKDFKSVVGIEGFVNLEYLFIFSNDLIDTIDVLELPSLKSFRLGENIELQSIVVSGHPSLEEIFFSGVNGADDNLNQLNISNIPTLNKIRLQQLRVLESLEIYANNNLEELLIHHNDLIPVVDVSDLKSLVKLELDGSFNEIITGQLPLLEEYRWNLNDPKELDLTLYPKLKKLYIQPQYSNITNVEISDNSTLEELYIQIFFNLHTIKCNNLSSLQRIWVQDSHDLKTVELDSLSVINEVYFQGNSNISELTIKNALELEKLTFLADKVRNYTLYNLPMMTDLKIGSSRIEALDLSTLNALTNLELTSSSIEQLYIKNNTNENLDCTDCSSLDFICSDDIDTFKNLPPDVYVGTFCPYTSGGDAHEINGEILYDYGNNDCDSLTIPMPYVSLAIHQLDNLVGLLTSNGVGKYGLYYDQDSFILMPSQNSFNSLFDFLPDSIYVLPIDSILETTQDICVKAKEDILNLELVMLDPQETRPGEEAKYTLMIRNSGSLVPEGEITLDFEGEFLSLVETNPMYVSTDSSQIGWNIPTLLPFEEVEYDVTFLLNTPMDDFPLNADDTLKFEVKAMIESLALDTTISNTLCDVVVNSFDPNDKQCMQGRWIEQKSLDDYLYYTIRFENLGTADARNIVVQDTLDRESYIISSFQLVGASHEVSASMDRNIVSFVFEDINLGSEDDENDGYLIFKIKPRENLELGFEISNDASIYFDYNFPIHTNIAQTEVVVDAILSDFNVDHYEVLKFYPNIGSGLIYLDNRALKGDIVVLDINGCIVLKSKVSKDSVIDISTLESGTYIIRMTNLEKLYIGKLIKI